MTKIFIHSPCGGTGVTTITASLGVALARSGYPVLVNGQSEFSIARHFENWRPLITDHGVPPFHGIRKVQVESQLFMTSGLSQEHASSSSFGSVFSIDDNSGEFVLVESRSKVLPGVEELSQFHLLVVVVSADASSFCELASLMKTFCKANKKYKPIKLLVLLNNSKPESLISRDIHYLLESSLLQSFYPDSLLNDESVKEALACGIPMAEHAPYSPFSHALNAFAQNLIMWSDEIHAAA